MVVSISNQILKCYERDCFLWNLTGMRRHRLRAHTGNYQVEHSGAE